MDENEDESRPVMDEIDDAILQAVSIHPDKSNNAIARQLVRVGTINNPQTVYQRLSKNSYLSREIGQLREQVKQDHTRVVFPLAHKRMVKALKNKDLHDKDVFPYVKLAYDKELSSKEEREQVVNTQINIESLQLMINNARPDK